MSEITGPKFACPSCGKQYKWKPELAGKKGKCKCGGVLAIPAKPPAEPAPPTEPETDPFGDSYDVSDQPVQQAANYSTAPTTIMSAPTAAAPPRPIASTGAGDEGRRQLHVVPALKWIGIGVLVGAFALWELSDPTDPDAPGRKRGIRAILVLANNIHPLGSFFILAAFAAFMLVVGVLVLFGKAKDDDYEHEKQQGQWPASRGQR